MPVPSRSCLPAARSRAALITRGLAEIARLGCALGARAETFAGLSGMGDLIVTCTSRLSRNRAIGERLGRGEPIDEILGSMQQAAEGAWNCAIARTLARERGVNVPVTDEVYALVLYWSTNQCLSIGQLLLQRRRTAPGAEG